MSKAPPPPPPLPPRSVSSFVTTSSKYPSSIPKSLQEELESRIPKSEEVFIDSATCLYSSDYQTFATNYKCDLCHKRIQNPQAHANSHSVAIFDWLYLGSMNNSQDRTELLRIGIDTIVNCTSECSNAFPNNYPYFNFALADSFRNTELIKEAAFLLENLRLDGHKVFIHCVQGINRSVAVVLFYLMKYVGMPLREALYFMKNRRSIVKPSRNLLQQLIELESELHGLVTFEVSELWESEDD